MPDASQLCWCAGRRGGESADENGVLEGKDANGRLKSVIFFADYIFSLAIYFDAR